MPTTTTNFGWTVPSDTDLVKDGAAAIRTALGGVDTSLVDLKGGTTGQVLAKQTNTDLDYTWVTPEIGDITAVTAGTGISGGGTTGAVTITNSMATAIDAKGDIIAGTANDAFSRLAVGANNTVLTADSATATGLKWATPSSGMTLITRNTFSGAAVAYNIDSVFAEGTYSDYVIVLEKGFAGAADQLRFQLRFGTTTQTTGYFSASYGYKYTGVVLANGGSANGAYFHLGGPGATNLTTINLSILGNTAYYTGQITTNDDGTFFAGGYQQSMGGSITGMRVFSAAGTNNISGTLSIYGLAR